MQEILNSLPDKWIPFAVIGAFAGCRAAEIHRLDWMDIDLEERHITVESSKSKRGKRRVVPISNTLYAYLSPLSQTAPVKHLASIWQGRNRDRPPHR